MQGTAHMNRPDNQPNPRELPLFHWNAARYLHWRRRLEAFKATQGVAALLVHVSHEDWHRHYAANEDAFSAVQTELARID
jgi:hypothetical protein